MVRLTGVDPAEFERLAREFIVLWEREYCVRTVRGRERLGFQPTGYKGGFRHPRTMLFFVLLYHQVYPSQKALGTLFGMTQQWASVWLCYLKPLVQRVLKRPLLLPDRKPLGWEDLLRLEPALLRMVELPEVAGANQEAKDPPNTALTGLW